MSESTHLWVSALKARYSHLPDTLTLEVELSRLEALAPWMARVAQLRAIYDTMDRSLLPDDIRSAGKRQIVPVLLSIDTMTKEETEAWHDLFVCLSAMLADLTYEYWKSAAALRASALTLEDLLNYLPIAFLYVLSSYNAYPDVKEHATNFSQSEDGRVRLTTWVHLDTRRHINTYLQQYLYTVRHGSTALQRFKSRIVRLEQRFFAQEGRLPTLEELSALAETDVDPDLYHSIGQEQAVSLSSRLSSDTTTAHEDILAEDALEVESLYDPVGHLEARVAANPLLARAAHKLVASDEPLTMLERFALGY